MIIQLWSYRDELNLNGELMLNDCWGQCERTVSARWTLYERWARTEGSGERKSVNGNRTVSARWTHGKRKVSESKMGKKIDSGTLLFEFYMKWIYQFKIVHMSSIQSKLWKLIYFRWEIEKYQISRVAFFFNTFFNREISETVSE